MQDTQPPTPQLKIKPNLSSIPNGAAHAIIFRATAVQIKQAQLRAVAGPLFCFRASPPVRLAVRHRNACDFVCDCRCRNSCQPACFARNGTIRRPVIVGALPDEIFLIDRVNPFTRLPVTVFPGFVIFAAHSNRQFSLFGRFSWQC